MSFNYDIKKELCDCRTDDIHQKISLLYGILTSARTFNPSRVAIHTEHKSVALYFATLLVDLVDVHPTIGITKQINGKTKLFIVSVDKPDEMHRILENFEYLPSGDEEYLPINHNLLSDDASVSAFLRGVFLDCGMVTDPVKGYHLELNLYNDAIAEQLYQIISEVGFIPRISERKGSKLLYLKDIRHIEDFLTYIGAVKSSLKMMDIEIYKQLRNNANRVANCDAANIGKTVNASMRQIAQIRKIIEIKGEDGIPEDLRSVAKLRLAHPDAPLRELAELCEDGLSRSGINHRLKRLSELYEEMTAAGSDGGQK